MANGATNKTKSLERKVIILDEDTDTILVSFYSSAALGGDSHYLF